MKQKILTTISAPEVGPGTPPELKDLLLRLGDALKRAEPYQAGRLLTQSLEYMVRFFAGAAAGARASQGAMPADLNARLANAPTSLDECQLLLRDALLSLSEMDDHPVQESLQKVFFVGRPMPGKPIFPRLHTRWLRVAGEPEAGLSDLPALANLLERLESEGELDDYLEEVLKFLPVLLRWTASGQSFFRRWKMLEDGDRTMLEHGSYRFELCPTFPAGRKEQWAPAARPPAPQESPVPTPEAVVPARKKTRRNNGATAAPNYKRRPQADTAEIPAPPPPPRARPQGPELEEFEAPRLDERAEQIEISTETGEREMPVELKALTWSPAQRVEVETRLSRDLTPLEPPAPVAKAVQELVSSPTGAVLVLEGVQGILTPATFDKLAAQHGTGQRRASWSPGPYVHPQLMLEHLNDALRQSPLQALDVRVLRELQTRTAGQALRDRLGAYLAELQRRNQTPILLFLDLPPRLNVEMPAELAEDVYLVASFATRPEGAGVKIGPEHPAFFERLMRDLPSDPEAGEQLLQACAGRLLRLRAGLDALKAGLGVPSSPDSFWADLMASGKKRKGFSRIRRVFTLLTAAPDGLDLSALAALGVAHDAVLGALELLPSVLAWNGQHLSMANHDLRADIAAAFPKEHREGCRQLLAWGLGQVEQADERRLEALYRWAAAIDEPEWLESVARSAEVARRRDRLNAELDAEGRLVAKAQILSAWSECLERRVAAPGGESFQDDLGWAYNSRGLGLLRLGRYNAALEDIDRAIGLFGKVVKRQPGLRNGLAAAYNRRSEVFRSQGKTERALEDATEAVRHYRAVVEEQGRQELTYLLAMAYHNRAGILRSLHRLDEAARDCQVAVKLYTDLAAREPAYREQLAGAYHTSGILALGIEHYPRAREQFTRALDILAELVDARPQLRNEMASALANRGAAHHRSGQPDLAIGDYGRAIQLRATMVEEGRLDLRGDLAVTYTNRGLVYDQLGHRKEALSDYRRAIALRSQLVEGEGREDLRGDLAFTHICRGSTFRALKQYENAVAEYQRAIADYLAVGTPAARSDLAAAYNSLGVTCLEQGDLEQAVASCGRAIQIYTEMESPSPDQLGSLAVAHNNRGEAYRRLGALASAQGEFGLAAGVYQKLADEHGRVDLLADLAVTRTNRAAVSVESLDYAGAVEEATEAIQLLELLVQGDTDLNHQLAWAYACRADALVQQGQHEVALEDAGQAIDRYGVLVEDLGQVQYQDELASAYRSRGITHGMLGRPEQAINDFSQAIDNLRMVFNRDGNNWANELSRLLLLRARGSAHLRDIPHAVRDTVEAFSHAGGPISTLEMEVLQQLLDDLRELAEQDERRGIHSMAAQHYGDMIKAARGAMQRSVDPPDLRAELALALRRRGIARHNDGDLMGALEDFEGALNLYRELVFQSQAYDLGADMAGTCIDRARTYQAQNDAGRAIWNYEHAIETYKVLIEQEGRLDLRGDLARAHYSRALLYLNEGQQEEALADFGRVAAIRTELAREDAPAENLPEVAQALLQCGRILDDLDRPAESWDAYHKAANVFVALIERLEQRELMPELARCYLAQARLGESRKQPDAAARALGDALRILRTAEGTPELALELLEGVVDTVALSPAPAALDGLLTELVALWEYLVVRPGGSDWPPSATQLLLAVSSNLKGKKLTPFRLMIVALACASAQRETSPNVSCNLAGMAACVKTLAD